MKEEAKKSPALRHRRRPVTGTSGQDDKIVISAAHAARKKRMISQEFLGEFLARPVTLLLLLFRRNPKGDAAIERNR
jgi:hypothetical protein